MGHAFFSPSAAKRWLACAAAPSREQKYPEDEGGPDARRGTNCHALLEQSLNLGSWIDPKIMVWPHPDDVPTAEETEGVKACFDYVQRRCAQLAEAGTPPVVHAELEVSLVPLTGHDLCKGTADVVICADTFCEVIDLKTGGRLVEADDPQLRIYGLAAALWAEPKAETIMLTVFQPKRPAAPDNIPRSQTFSRDELATWVFEKVIPAMWAALAPEPVATPGEETCRWCRARSDCRERAQALFQVVESIQSEPLPGDSLLASEPVENLSPEDLAKFLHMAPILEARIKEARERAIRMLKDRQPVPGWKLVHGRRSRKWKHEDPEETVKALRKLRLKKGEIFEERLRSPAQIQKLGLDVRIWQKIQDQLVVETPGNLTLAPASDKRPDAVPVCDFKPIAEEN